MDEARIGDRQLLGRPGAAQQHQTRLGAFDFQQFRFAATDEQRAKAVTHLDDARRALYGILAD